MLQLLTRELFSASRGLFTYHSGVRTLWFKQQEEPLDSQDKREDASTAAAADSEPAAAKPAAAAAADSATSAAEGSPKPEEKAAGAPASSDQDSSSNNRSELIPEGKAKEYWLTGLLASMAVYNDILMPLSLPIVVRFYEDKLLLALLPLLLLLQLLLFPFLSSYLLLL